MRKSGFLLLFCIFIIPGLVNGAIGTGANFLKIGVGPRQIGLGSAFTGVSDDIYSIYWNPAGLGFIRNWEVSFMADRYFADIYMGALSGAKQYRFLGSRKFTVGAGIFHLGMPDWDSMENRSETDQPMGSASNTMFTLSLAQRLDWLPWEAMEKKLSLGVNIKWVQSELVNESASVLAFDIGANYNMELYDRPFMIGLAVQNIGDSLKFIRQGSPIPFGVRSGVSYRLGGCSSHQFLLATDLAWYRDSNIKLGLGAEYWFRQRLGLRGGYVVNSDDLGDLSFGLSYRLGLANSGARIDGTYQDYDALKSTFSGAYTMQAVGPEPFRLVSPDDSARFCYDSFISFEWEDAPGSDRCDVVNYRLLIDNDRDMLNQALRRLKNNPMDSVNILFSQFCSGLKAKEKMPLIPDSTCYWTVLAYDQDNHTRTAEKMGIFFLVKPDITIRQIAIETGDGMRDVLYGFDDPTKSILKVVLQNNGDCDCGNFLLLLHDSLMCPVDFNQFSQKLEREIGEFEIEWLPADSLFTFETEFGVKSAGRHIIWAHADSKDKVPEFNENNNKYALTATTGMQGVVEIVGVDAPTREEMYADSDAILPPPEIRLTKIFSETCEVPLVPLVFFNRYASNVATEYIAPVPDQPFSSLEEIAIRMKQYPKVCISLTGFIDPDTEMRSVSENKNLALARAEAVKMVLVRNWRIEPERIIARIDENNVTRKRIEVHSTITEVRPIDLQRISEENRRVEIAIKHDAENSVDLFCPKSTQIRAYFVEPIRFVSIVRSLAGCSAWQLEIVKGEQHSPIVKLPFEIDNNKQMVSDTITWHGTDQIGNLIEVNQDYAFRVNLSDLRGNWNYSDWKYFRVAADSIVNHRFIQLMKFDKPQPVYPYFEKQLAKIASKFIDEVQNELRLSEASGIQTQEPTVKSYLLGFTCVIGREERLLELANEERTHAMIDNFRNAINTELDQHEINSPKLQNAVLARLDITAHLNARDYVPVFRHGEWYKEPFLIFPVCSAQKIVFGGDTPVGRNYNRRVEIVVSRIISSGKKADTDITGKR